MSEGNRQRVLNCPWAIRSDWNVSKLIVAILSAGAVVLPLPAKKHQIIVDAITKHTGMTTPEALEWLSEKVFRPAKVQGDGQRKKRKHADAGDNEQQITHSLNLVRLNQILSHVIGRFKSVVFNTWCDVVTKVPSKVLPAKTAGDWKDDVLFFKTPIGRQGIISGVAKGFQYLEVGHRARPAVGLGVEELTDMSLGHFCQGAFVGHEALVNIHSGIPHGSSGPDIYCYQSRVNMVTAHDDVLPKSTTADRGMIVLDGEDPNCAIFDNEFMPLPVDGDLDLATDSEVSGGLGLGVHASPAAPEAPAAAPAAASAAAPAAALLAALVANLVTLREQAEKILASARAQVKARLAGATVDDDDLL